MKNNFPCRSARAGLSLDMILACATGSSFASQAER
jgi:hypothetical protein